MGGTRPDAGLSRRAALALGGGAAVSLVGAPPASARVPDRAWARLARHVRGTLTRPGDPAYARLRRLQNPVYDDARPLAVLSVRAAADVATAIAFARHHDLRVALRSGGHSYPGWSAGDDRLVIDVRPLSAVRLDGPTATIGAGASLAHVSESLGARGRGLAAGSCATVGIAGLTLGGGQGIVGRAHGLTCDAVTSMRVVTAAGEVVTASGDEEPDLFWALRGGGGGQLGVVTSFELDTFAAPRISTAYLRWPLSAADEVVPAWEAWAPAADPRLWSTVRALSGERRPDGPVVAVSATWTGPDAGLDRRLQRFLTALPRPDVDDRQRRSFLAVTRAFAGSSSRTRFAATSHVAYDRLTDPGVATLVDRVRAAHDSGLVEAGIALDALGGRIAEPAPGDTAFVHRRARAIVQYTAVHGRADRRKALRVVRGAREALRDEWGDHAYVNYADAALPNAVEAYFGANAARLATVRQAYDPDDFFRQPQGF